MRRAWETLRYPAGEDEVRAELLALAVVPEARRQGIASRLGEAMLAAMGDKGVERVKVVVGDGNGAAVAAYEKMGFVSAGHVEVHKGERSQVLQWSASPRH